VAKRKTTQRTRRRTKVPPAEGLQTLRDKFFADCTAETPPATD